MLQPFLIILAVILLFAKGSVNRNSVIANHIQKPNVVLVNVDDWGMGAAMEPQE